MLQTLVCNPAGCDSDTRCVTKTSCGPQPPPPAPECGCDLAQDLVDVELDGPGDIETVPLSIYSNFEILGGGVPIAVRFTFPNETQNVARYVEAGGSGAYYDNEPAFTANFLGLNPGRTKYKTRLEVQCGANVKSCGATAFVNVGVGSPWWQSVDGDVIATGKIQSKIPASGGYKLLTNSAGNSVGTAYYSGSVLPTNVSTENWKTDALYPPTDVPDYEYFEDKMPVSVPVTTTGSLNITNNSGSLAVPSMGSNYFVYHHDGNMALGASSLLARKVILYVNGDLTINGNITLTPGTGFFMAIVNGNINVNPTVGGGAVPNLEGIFFANGTFDTGTSGTGDSQLNVRGVVIARGALTANGDGGAQKAFNLQRDLASNEDTPAEEFTYGPDLVLNYPAFLGERKLTWREVAP